MEPIRDRVKELEKALKTQDIIVKASRDELEKVRAALIKARTKQYRLAIELHGLREKLSKEETI